MAVDIDPKPGERDWWEAAEEKFLDGLSFWSVNPDMEERWGPFVAAKRGRLQVSNEELMVVVALPDLFPRKMPKLFLLRPEEVGMIPHVEPDGYICYAEHEETLLDASNPEGIIRQAVEHAQEVLEAGLAGENQRDFVDEFNAYWGNGHEKNRAVISFVSMGDQVRQIYFARPRSRHQKKEPSAFVDSPELPKSYTRNSRPSRYRFPWALYVPLPPDTLIRPPDFGEMWSLAEIRSIVRDSLSQAALKRLHRLGKTLSGSEHYALFGLPRGNEDHAVFGIHFERLIDGKQPLHHPFVTSNQYFRPVPLAISRRDRSFLIARGGGYPDLADHKVMVVGCGAVGSVVADQLAKAGVGHLVLVDPDTLGMENTFRHTLGSSRVHQPKVSAVSADLATRFPYLATTLEKNRIENILRDKPELLAEVDLVVVAIGDPNMELLLNEHLHSSSETPATIFTWLEPLGIGGHALLTNSKQTDGCFSCLFQHRPYDSPDVGLYNAASFTAPNQTFTERPGGCRTAFVPYGAVHATQTACLAVQLATDYLRSVEDDHPLLSWKGENTDFTRKGYRQSGRATYNRQQLFDLRYDYKSATCPICNNPS